MYAVKNISDGTYLGKFAFHKDVNKAVTFPTFKRAQKEAKRLNERMNRFYFLNDNDFPMFRGKTCTDYQPCRLP